MKIRVNFEQQLNYLLIPNQLKTPNRLILGGGVIGLASASRDVFFRRRASRACFFWRPASCDFTASASESLFLSASCVESGFFSASCVVRFYSVGV